MPITPWRPMNNGLSIPRAGAGSLGTYIPRASGASQAKNSFEAIWSKTKFERIPSKSRAIAAVMLIIVAAEIAVG